MAFRTTIYCNDKTATKLRELLDAAKSNPVRWSAHTGKSAPTNTNQLITRLIELGHDLIAETSSPPVLAESQPIWEVGEAPPVEAWAGIPTDLSINFDHYLSEIDAEARERHISLEEVVREWRQRHIEENEVELSPLEEDPLWQMVGIGHSGLGDVSENHDEYLVQWRLERMTPPQSSQKD